MEKFGNITGSGIAEVVDFEIQKLINR